MAEALVSTGCDSCKGSCAIELDTEGWCTFVDGLRAGIFLLEEDSTVVYANQAARSHVSVSPIGLKCKEVFQSSEAKCAACPVNTGIVLSKKANRAFRVLCRRARAYPFRPAPDRPPLIVVEIHGVRSELNAPLHPATWLSQALKEWGEEIDKQADGTLMMQDLIRRVLNRADAFLWNLIQSSVDAIMATDMKGNIFIFNNEATNILGYRAEEVIGRMHITDLYTLKTAREIMSRLLSSEYGGKNKLVSYDMEAVDKQGERVPVRVNASLVMINGDAFGTVGFFQDQRKRIKMEEELSQAQAQLLQAEKMASLGRLAAGIAHQINNPLSGIMLFSNLLLETEEIVANDEWRSDITRIAEDAERCRSIVKELLEFARQTQQRLQPVELNQALANKVFLLEPQVLFQNVEVIQDYDPEIPVIHVDPQQLDHVLMNLVINAAQAMNSRGTLTLQTRYDAEEEMVEIQVRDTGHGIPEEIRSRIFEPFFTTKEVGQGTGLGLSMVYGIVERHGGLLQVESEVNVGTTFTVRLPVGGPVGRKL